MIASVENRCLRHIRNFEKHIGGSLNEVIINYLELINRLQIYQTT